MICVRGGLSVPNCRVSGGKIIIEFGSAGDAEGFLNNTRGGMDLRGRRIMIERDGVGASNLSATDQLILRGVPRSATEEDIRDAFGGRRDYIKAVSTGASKDFTVVQFKTTRDAVDALDHFTRSGSRIRGSKAQAFFAGSKESESAPGVVDIPEEEQPANTVDETVTQAIKKGPNSDMWSSYLTMHGVSTETTNGADQMPSGLSSGSYYDSDLGLWYDPATYYFVSAETGKYFTYDYTQNVLVEIGEDGQPLAGGERRPYTKGTASAETTAEKQTEKEDKKRDREAAAGRDHRSGDRER